MPIPFAPLLGLALGHSFCLLMKNNRTVQLQALVAQFRQIAKCLRVASTHRALLLVLGDLRNRDVPFA